jgi:hypothetical protein
MIRLHCTLAVRATVLLLLIATAAAAVAEIVLAFPFRLRSPLHVKET